MNTTSFRWAMPLLLLLASGCCKSDPEPNVPSTRAMTIRVDIATPKGAGSRATVDYGTDDATVGERFKWSAGDAFDARLWSEEKGSFEPVARAFIIKDGDAGKPVAEFTCADFPAEGSYHLLAVHPVKIFKWSDVNGKATATYATSYAATQKGSTTDHLNGAMLIYGKSLTPVPSSSTETLTFKHLTALLRFHIKNVNDEACVLKSIAVKSSSAKTFGTDGNIGQEVWSSAPVLSTTRSTDAVTLTFAGGYALAKEGMIDGYLLTLPGEALTGQKLTFTLTLTDAEGKNERSYISPVLDAGLIVSTNTGAATWERGKRYWFDLTLSDRIAVKFHSVSSITDWEPGIGGDGHGN